MNRLLVSAIALALLGSGKLLGQNLEEKEVYSPMYDAELIEFRFQSAPAFIVKPKSPAVADASHPRPWVWYAPFIRGTGTDWELPTQRHADVVKELLANGFYFCGVDVGESFGSPKGRKTFTDFYNFVVKQYGLSPRPCLFPVSRGGLMLFTWAVEHPDCVQCIGGIYPASDLRSFPPLETGSTAFEMTPEQYLQELGQHNPMERLAPLAKADVPIFILHGDLDEPLPIDVHSAELARRYRALGGKIDLIVVKGKGHELAPEFWQNPELPRFFMTQGLAAKQRKPQ